MKRIYHVVFHTDRPIAVCTVADNGMAAIQEAKYQTHIGKFTNATATEIKLSEPFPLTYPAAPDAPVMFKIWRAEGGWSSFIPEGTPEPMASAIRDAVEKLRAI